MADTILLYTSNKLGSSPTVSFRYPLDGYGNQIQMAAMENLGMKYDPHYSLFLSQGPSNEQQKVKSKFTLRSLGATDGMTLYVALIDPLTGNVQENPDTSANENAPTEYAPLNIDPAKFNKQRKKLPPIRNPSSHGPRPLISQNGKVTPPQPPPSLLAAAKHRNNAFVRPQQTVSGPLYAPPNNSTLNLPAINSSRSSSMFPPINKTPSAFPPVAPNTARRNPPSNSLNPIPININQDINDKPAATDFSISTNQFPIPEPMQHYLCFYKDYRIINNVGNNSELVREHLTGTPYILRHFAGATNPELFYKEYQSIFNAESASIIHINGFTTSPLAVLYEYHAKGTLDEILEQARISNPPPEWNATTKIIILFGIAAGMRHLHENRIMHRNLKPSNITIDNHFYPYIADVGFTREYNRDPSYMAPELLTGCSYKSKIDVFAFGMICYHVLTMHPPFPSNLSHADIKQKIISGERPQIPSSIPNTFINLIQRCWAQDASARPTFNRIVDGFINKNFLLPDTDVQKVLEYQRIICPNNEDQSMNYFTQIKTKADDGDPKSIYELAICYRDGKAVAKNITESRRLFKLAADAGNPEAMYEHGRNLIRFENRHEDAVKYIKSAAQNGISYARTFLSNYTPPDIFNSPNVVRPSLSSHPITSNSNNNSRTKTQQNSAQDSPSINKPKNVITGVEDAEKEYQLGEALKETSPEESFHHFQAAADGGYLKAQMCVAVAFHNGTNGAPVDLTLANKYYKMASLQGNPKALCNLAYNMQRGEGIEQDVKTANTLYKKSADAGYSVAQYNYAVNLTSGNGVNKNLQEANRLFKLAADQGHTNAAYSYAVNLSKGNGIKVDLAEANKYYKIASDQGNSNAMYAYATNLLKGNGCKKDLQEANKYLKLAADKGNSFAQAQYATHLSNGTGIDKNPQEAFKYNKMSADNGNPRGMCNYAYALQTGLNGKKNLAEANKFYKLAAEKNYAPAQLNYACNLENGLGVAKNLELANQYHKMAADQGNANAQLNYGVNLLKGNGIQKNPEEANKYIKMSAEQNNPRAIYQYGVNLLKGNGVFQDSEMANQYLKKAADMGNSNSQFYYGYNLFNGNGIEKDPNEANRYYKLAADQGNANAQCNLACSYLNGLGVEKDITQANKYYKMSADQENAVAQFNYGLNLINGNGVEKNVELGISYLEKAAKKNNSSAQFQLALCYETGKGVKKNEEMYETLILQSAKGGNRLAQQRAKKLKPKKK